MIREWMVLTGLLLPALALSCEGGDRQQCKQQFRALVAYRIEAIDTAFGDLFGTLPQELEIKFVTRKDPEHAQFGGHEAYDMERHKLIFPRRVLSARTPNPLRWSAYYWPFYQHEQHRLDFPIIEVIDNVLWSAFLQQAARARGQSWPHEDCVAVDVGKRLPCEMLVKGIAEHVKALRGPLFNSNRLDRIWPQDFLSFSRRVWRTDAEYQEVQRYGGILLVRPLIDEFGIPRALTYAAQTPFQVEGDNLHLSAVRYQQRAQEVLRAASSTTSPGPLLTGTQPLGPPRVTRSAPIPAVE